jgi:hypothetical protein
VAQPDPAFEPERWGDDPKLVALLGEQGAAQFRALFDGFPEAVGVLWAIRDAGGRIVDFSFGYGNPSILRAFRLPAATRDRYTLLEALPRMRGSRAFDAYVRVCEAGEPWVHEVTYDTPFGDGYMLGTFVHRTAKLGDGLVNPHRRRSASCPRWRCSRARARRPTASASGSRCPDAIVVAHGGRIWVEPAEGGGSAFRFTLPRASARGRYG